jgi:hypothetical protein
MARLSLSQLAGLTFAAGDGSAELLMTFLGPAAGKLQPFSSRPMTAEENDNGILTI